MPPQVFSSAQPSSIGTVNKVSLVFPRVFWPIDVERFGILADQNAQSRGRHFMMVNMYNSTKVPCLMVYYSGLAALEIEGKEDMIILKEILNMLARMFPFECPLPYPIETIVTRWASDQFSGGENVQHPSTLNITIPKDCQKIVHTHNHTRSTDGMQFYLNV